MESQEIKDLVAAEVKAATASLQKEVEALKEQLANSAAAAPAEVQKPKKFVTPEGKIKINNGLVVQFTAPTFVLNKKLYVSEAEVENKDLIAALVKQQTVEGAFKDGLLKKVS